MKITKPCYICEKEYKLKDLTILRHANTPIYVCPYCINGVDNLALRYFKINGCKNCDD